MQTATIIYHIKPYKVDKLFFSESFRALFNKSLPLTRQQYEYKIVTRCWFQHLNEADIAVIMAWWWKKHGIKPNYHQLRNFVIPETFLFTRPLIQAQRRLENQRAKQRRLEKANGVQQ